MKDGVDANVIFGPFLSNAGESLIEDGAGSATARSPSAKRCHATCPDHM
jgi:hypothetical protein